jgi:TRAP-type C4-dicarboxylate transport system substrate-binding protein
VLCRKFASEIEKRTGGKVKAQVYAGSSLMKTNAQFSAMRKGALDMSLYPLPYAGRRGAGDQHRPDARHHPVVRAGAKWKTGEVGRLLNKLLEDKGIVMVSWIFQAVVPPAAPADVAPEDAKGMKIRGGSREMDIGR